MQRYLISRNGQIYGPYTLEELQRYVASGHVLLTDLAHAEPPAGSPHPEPGPAWTPVSQLLPEAQPAGAPTYTPPLYVAPGAPIPGQLSPTVEAPPNLNWILYLFLVVVTCGLFAVVYELLQAAWIRRIYSASRVLPLYLVALLFYVINFAASVARGFFTLQTHTAPPHGYGIVGGVSSLIYLVLILVARFTMRSELEQHYNTVEPIGLSLSGIMTFFFGTFYFQYHFNRINDLKRAMSYGYPTLR